VHAGGRARI